MNSPSPASVAQSARLWRNASLVTLREGTDLGVVTQGAVLAQGERIVYAGPERDAPSLADRQAEVIDCEGRWITPGLIDCHTHLVHAGNRADEFERRLAGASYADIAAAGGGILSTLRATRAATPESLIAESLPRLDALLAEGVTTIEIKSGYGLHLASEARLLRAARTLGRLRDVTVKTTFLGAHALPPEANGDRDAYIDEVCRMLPVLAAEGLVDAVDGFCESIAFTPAQIERVFATAAALHLPVKLHADQLSDGAGAALAARHGALSADHLEHTGEPGLVAMAQAGTVAVLLPGAYYFLRETHAPPIAGLRRHGIAMAVATDCNPGTSPLTSLLLAMNMAATQFRLTVAECLTGTPRAAARALGTERETGSLEAGKYADLAIWDIGSPSELVYRMGLNPLHARIWRGG
jgi:imidazolonepropionase